MVMVLNKTKALYFLLWSLVGPIFAWLFQLVASFLLASYDCIDNIFWIHCISAVAFATSLSGQWAARKSRVFFQIKNLNTHEFLSKLFFWLGAILSLTIFAQSLPNFTMELCQ